jgi:hypothetical protein
MSHEIFIMDSHAKVADIGGQKLVIAITRDITERKNMEEQIRITPCGKRKCSSGRFITG